MDRFLSPLINTDANKGINDNFGYAKLQNVGKLDISKTLEVFKKKLDSNSFSQKEFDYGELKFINNKI